jgi:hypothetical protein
MRFAFVMRWELEFATTRGEGACACTVGAFHKRNPTGLKNLCVCQ